MYTRGFLTPNLIATDQAKMAREDTKFAKRFRRLERRTLSFGLGLIIGCLLVSMTYVVMFKADVNYFFSISNEEERVAADVDKSLNTASDVEPPRKPLCDLSYSFRTDVCDIEGDIRIHGKHSSTVMLLSPSGSGGETNESWQVKPQPRKWDANAMHNVRTVYVHRSRHHNAPQCTVTHTVPGVVFSDSGKTGNIFHDFADVLLPLFETTRRLNGQVQFLLANNRTWWVYKYRHIIQKLSSYPLIDYDHDDRVHCFNHVIVGLKSDRDLMIDASRSANGVSIMDYVEFLREAYSLPRDRPWPAGEFPGKRPRLLFIARRRTRRFVNLDKVVAVAEEVGFEVVATEPKFMRISEFASTINSCDVMVGVHGAGMTNLMFLPTNAIVIQVVPLAKMDRIAKTYGEPAGGMKLRYLQYDISEEESTLIDLYPRDHRVFRDPDSIHKEGWFNMGEVYLKQQNVKLDVKRFRPVLEKALQLLKEKKTE
ncbi:hypothetical protein Cni_G02064 [Canna indica]|uniref:Glycosyltransferase 61 catalytic domain-containing protein n=1 Tax=Canna indica TaxID=4628 RepID=A0AAQ3Q2D1_9LILI|nr:hypothetical protein Cni_G02064 [Canna indica]